MHQIVSLQRQHAPSLGSHAPYSGPSLPTTPGGLVHPLSCAPALPSHPILSYFSLVFCHTLWVFFTCKSTLVCTNFPTQTPRKPRRVHTSLTCHYHSLSFRPDILSHQTPVGVSTFCPEEGFLGFNAATRGVLYTTGQHSIIALNSAGCGFKQTTKTKTGRARAK